MEIIMTTALLDERKYRELLDQTLPVVIRTEQEHKRLLRTAARLMEKPEQEITEEEGRLLEMLSMLIEEYEDRVHPLPKPEPHKMLNHLLEEKELKPRDLWTILPKSRVSEILNGKRGISKAQAKKLAEYFGVSAELFI
jgi:HTH-type transcriptional regulator/antitoxin HigA